MNPDKLKADLAGCYVTIPTPFRDQPELPVDEMALRDYVRFGLADDADKLRLLIDPAIEYQIYRTVPHDLHRSLAKLEVRAGFIGGADSDVVRRVGLSSMRHAGFAFKRVKGGHLFPLEHPAIAAEAILEMTARLAA